MKIGFYLIVSSSGLIRTTKNKPGLDQNEVSVKMSITLPDMLFRKPQLSADIVVPDEAASPVEIPVDVANNVKEAIQQATGMEVKITFQNEPTP